MVPARAPNIDRTRLHGLSISCVRDSRIGAVGGYYGAKLARAGHDVTFIARGAHLAAIRERGLQIRSPMLGDFTVRARAEEDTAQGRSRSTS